eukprot:SAG22_NODE_102_length_20195_cov_3.248308_16_plen_67_part_00
MTGGWLTCCEVKRCGAVAIDRVNLRAARYEPLHLQLSPKDPAEKRFASQFSLCLSRACLGKMIGDF